MNILAASKVAPDDRLTATNAAKVTTGLRWRGIKAASVSFASKKMTIEAGITKSQVPDCHHPELGGGSHFCEPKVLNDLGQLLC